MKTRKGKIDSHSQNLVGIQHKPKTRQMGLEIKSTAV